MFETLLKETKKGANRSVDENERRKGRRGKGRFALNRNFFLFHRHFARFASQVKCTAISVPKAESVVWSFAGRELNFTSNNTPFYVQEEYMAERVVSTVTLLDPISTYFGDYNCTVTNSFGTDSVIIKLTAHSKFDIVFAMYSPSQLCLISFNKLPKTSWVWLHKNIFYKNFKTNLSLEKFNKISL